MWTSRFASIEIEQVAVVDGGYRRHQSGDRIGEVLEKFESSTGSTGFRVRFW